MRGTAHAPRRLPMKFRAGETRIGGCLFPLAVLLLAAYVTYTLCDLLAQRAAGGVVGAGLVGGLGVPTFSRADLGSQAGGGGASAAKVSPAVKDKGTIHVMATSNGSPYLNWQTRIMYKTFELTQANGGQHMKYFTRLLHRRTDDELMAEVPTVRVDSLHASCDKWCEFPVADRPNAVAAWLKTPDALLGEWLYMIETDYVWMRPVPAPPTGSKPVAFHFHYINPMYPGLGAVLGRMWPGGDQTLIPCSGPAPVIITHPDLVRLMPKWEEWAEWIENDPEAKQKLGWVREMYAYDVAAAAAGIPHEVQEPSTTVLISQPPNDDRLGGASAFHYTWGSEFKNSSGGLVWMFDKRPFTEARQVRRIRETTPSLPPTDSVEKGYHLQDGKPVTKELLAVKTQMLVRMREAIALLPDLPDSPGCGWLDNEPACDFGCTQGVLCVPTGHTFKLPN